MTWMESQSWWNGPVGGGEPDSVPFPFRHIHMAVDIPLGRTVTGIVEVPFRCFTHGNVGTLKHVKWQDDRGGSAQTLIVKSGTINGVPVTLPRTLHEHEVLEGKFRIDTSKEENSGWRLWRFYGVWTHPNGNSHVARPIFPQQISNGKARKDASGYTNLSPTGWYKEVNPAKDWGYLAARMKASEFPTAPLSGVWTPTISYSLNDKGGSPPVVGYSIHLDPDFHHGEVGTILKSGTGGGAHKLSIDPATLTPGTHRLVARVFQVSGAKRHEGVGIYPFVVA